LTIDDHIPEGVNAGFVRLTGGGTVQGRGDHVLDEPPHGLPDVSGQSLGFVLSRPVLQHILNHLGCDDGPTAFNSAADPSRPPGNDDQVWGGSTSDSAR
jgi:hypothetical protein